MTWWAKFLIVVVFVLSLIFAGMSAVLFGNRQDYRSLLKQANDALAAKQDELTRDTKDLSAKLAAANEAATQAKTDRDEKQSRLDTATHELDRINAAMQAKDIDSQKDKNLNLEQANALGQLGNQVKSLLASEDSLKTENNKLTAQFLDEQSRTNKLQNENTALNDSLKATTTKLDQAQDTLKVNEEIFAELSRRNVEWRRVIAGVTTLPDIKAKVLRVDPQSNFVLLNAGAKEGVKKNFTFSVFRDGSFVAEVMVFDVQQDMSAARIIVPKLPIQRGDNAWTRLSG